MFGYMGPGKNVESVINAFKDVDKKVIIAGSFSDKNRFEKCLSMKSDNIEIINKYLSDEEYIEYLKATKCIMLPYNDIYNTHTSGVALDAVFDYKPVIASDVSAFSFIREFGLGIIYNNNCIKQAIEKMESGYDMYLSNIKEYLKYHEKLKRKFVDYLDS